MVHVGGILPSLQQETGMAYSQIKGQQVKRALLRLHITNVPAEESQGLPCIIDPLFTHCPHSIIRGVGGTGERGGL